MDLRIFAERCGMDTAQAAQLIRSRYGAIILSELVPFPAELVHRIAADYPDLAELKSDTLPYVGIAATPVHNAAMSGEVPQQQNEETNRTEKLLLDCLKKNGLVFCDTCSLLNDYFPRFAERYLPVFADNGARLYIPNVVMLELSKKAREPQTALSAQNQIRFLELKMQENLVALIGDEERPDHDMSAGRRGETAFADPVFIEKMIFFRRKGKNVLVITQDHSLTMDLLALNQLKSFSGRAVIMVKKINRDGDLVDNAADIQNPEAFY